MVRATLKVKPPRDDPARREQQRAVKRSLIELPAFGLTVLAAAVRRDQAAGYENYELPEAAAELAFTLKGALRLEMMNHRDARYARHRRLFGSNTKAKDLSAWRSRAYVAVYPNGKAAATAAAAMLAGGGESFLAAVARTAEPVALLQVNDVYLDETRETLFSDLLGEFLSGPSALLSLIGGARAVPTWREAV